MNNRGLISVNQHATIEPLMAILFIAAPWIFGFSEVESATTLSIVVGVVMLLAGAMTKWRMSLVKLIPLRTHMMTDVAIGALLILSPFIFGFSDEGGATRFMIAAGVIELIATLGTRWDTRDEVERSGRTARA
jgi:hypothetical protein